MFSSITFLNSGDPEHKTCSPATVMAAIYHHITCCRVETQFRANNIYEEWDHFEFFRRPQQEGDLAMLQQVYSYPDEDPLYTRPGGISCKQHMLTKNCTSRLRRLHKIGVLAVATPCSCWRRINVSFLPAPPWLAESPQLAAFSREGSVSPPPFLAIRKATN